MRERAQSFLKPEHQQRILQTFRAFAAEEGFSAVATREQITSNSADLSIAKYVKRTTTLANNTGDSAVVGLRSTWERWEADGRAFWQQMDALAETLGGFESEEASRG